MAERELQIIEEARITLNDKSTTSPRWSTERLMQLLSNAQDDMCLKIPMIVKSASIVTISGQEEYSLPKNCVKLLRATCTINDGSLPETKTVDVVPIVSYDTIERDNPTWESDYSSDFSAILVNALSQQQIRPYPLLARDVEYSKLINIRYQALPPKLGWEDDDSIEELSINEMWDYALTQYVIGMAFVDYGDDGSLGRSKVALGLYGAEATKALQLSKKSFAKRTVTTNYRAKVFRGNRQSRDCRTNNRGYRS